MRWLAAGLAALLFGTGLFASGVFPAAEAAENASILLSKTVNSRMEKRDLRPGDSVTYRLEFIVNDEDADGPATVVDQLPTDFVG